MSHYIIVNGVRVRGPHDPNRAMAESSESGVFEFPEIKYTPPHGMTPAQQGDEVAKILKCLERLGTIE